MILMRAGSKRLNGVCFVFVFVFFCCFVFVVVVLLGFFLGFFFCFFFVFVFFLGFFFCEHLLITKDDVIRLCGAKNIESENIK